MNCEVLNTLYVRSNGDVPCDCDAGEYVLLGKVSATSEHWSVQSLVTNHRFRHVRESLKRGEMPWPTVCGNCAFFRPDEAYADPIGEKLIRKVQVEPSLACRLRCPSCMNHIQVKIRPQPLLMDLPLFERLMRSLAEDGFRVQDVEYCGQGEPLLHPRFPDFVRTARRYLPNTVQRLITSGNFDYAEATGREPINEVMVSCDGVIQENYVRYRVNGEVEKPLKFMRDAVKAFDAKQQIVVWKYILFEWNDSDEEIRRAQEIAHELGVAALLFVYTHSKGKSVRFPIERAAEFPLYFPNIKTNATPVHYQLADSPAAAATSA